MLFSTLIKVFNDTPAPILMLPHCSYNKEERHPSQNLFLKKINFNFFVDLTTLCKVIKSVSMRKPGRSRQEVIMLKSPISLKLGTNVRYQELAYVTECQVKILNSLGDPGSPCKNRHFARLCIIN